MKNYLILLAFLLLQISALAQKEVFISTFSTIEKNYNYTENNEVLFNNSYLIKPIDFIVKYENGFMLGLSLSAYRYDNFNLVWKKFNTLNTYNLQNSGQNLPLDSRILPQLNLQKILVSDSITAFFIGATFGFCKNMINTAYLRSVKSKNLLDDVADSYYGQSEPKHNYTPIMDLKSGLFIFNKKSSPFYFKIESYFRVIFLSDVTFKQVRITSKSFPEPLEISQNIQLPAQKVVGIGFSIGYKFINK